jgi:pimeloyl-ACP methyl ester carboxylesterase
LKPPVAADLGGRLLTAVAAGVDAIVLRAARAAIDFAVMPSPGELGALHASAAFYLHPELQAEPRRFFPFLERPIDAPDATLLPRRTRIRGAERFALTFASTYEPAHPGERARHGAWRENGIVHVDLWLHRDRPARGTIVGLHGFGMGRPALDAAALMAPGLFASGLDVALLTLPLHGARTPSAAPFSGAPLTVPDVPAMNEAVGQAVHDLVHLLAWLRARSSRPVGLVGLSFGGYVAALMAGLTADLDFVATIVAPVCLGDLAGRFITASRLHGDGPGASEARETLRAAYRVHSPLAHPPRIPRHRLLIIAGAGDRIVPSEHAGWLWTHWDRPRLYWFRGSHLVPFGRRQMLRAVRHFLRDLGVV